MDPSRDLKINQNIDFGSTAAAFTGGQGDYTVEFEPAATLLEQQEAGYAVASLGVDFRVCTLHLPPRQVRLYGGTSGNYPGLYRRLFKKG